MRLTLALACVSAALWLALGDGAAPAATATAPATAAANTTVSAAAPAWNEVIRVDDRTDAGFAARRAAMLAALTTSQPAASRPASAPAATPSSAPATRRSAATASAPVAASAPASRPRRGGRAPAWDSLHAALAQRPDDPAAAEAMSNYFATTNDLDYTVWNGPRNEPDWKMMSYIRTWCQFGDKLSPKARQRLSDVMRHYRQLQGFGGTENHIINRVCLVMLIDQALGISDEKSAAARENFFRWVWLRGHRGFMEYNSPNYSGRSLMPLLHLVDFSRDEQVRQAAARVLDVMVTEMALVSLDGVRGGPWHRAANSRQITDSRTDTGYVVSYALFGNTASPAGYDVLGVHLATTTYRPPLVAWKLANDRLARGSYTVRHRVDTVDPRLDAYYHVAPTYILGCFQNAAPFVNHYYGSTNGANLQPWVLSFADPTKKLGVWRDLGDVNNAANKNTALVQHAGVLLFRGDFLDYGKNLGQPVVAELGQKRHTLYDLDVPGGHVFVSIVQGGGLGVLEVSQASEWSDFAAFSRKMAAAAATCSLSSKDGRESIIYNSPSADRLVYENGKLSVDENAVSTSDYPLMASPFARSAWDSGLWDVRYGGAMMRLDFADPSVSAGGGLLGQYFPSADFTGKPLSRLDYTLDYNWRDAAPAAGIGPANFSVRWEGQWLADYTGAYTFIITTDGAVKLWVDDKVVIDEPGRRQPPAELTGKLDLKPGRHNIRLEYSHTDGQAQVWVTWASPATEKQTMGLLGDLFPPPPAKKAD
jgi:hypothetical protein